MKEDFFQESHSITLDSLYNLKMQQISQNLYLDSPLYILLELSAERILFQDGIS